MPVREPGIYGRELEVGLPGCTSNGEGPTSWLNDMYQKSPEGNGDKARQEVAQCGRRTTSVAPTGNGSTRYIFMSYPRIDLSTKTEVDEKTTYVIPDDTIIRAVIVGRNDDFV
jgi:hypothetical protein